MMKWLKMNMLFCVLVAVLTIPLLAREVARAAAVDCSWSVVSSPNVGSGFNALVGVEAVSENDVWTVGNSTSSGGVDQTLIEHWDGTSWSVVPSPNVGSGHNTLDAVAAVSTNDIWTVGAWTSSSGSAQTLTEHWDGSSWSVVPSPNVGSSGSILVGVSAVSSDNVWAVGFTNFPGAPQTLIEHWDGTSWSVVPSPNVAGSSQDLLKGVTAINTNNVWAVGYYRNGSNTYQTLIEQWDGTNWNIVPSPNAGSGDNFLNGVAPGPGAGNIWAVGVANNQALTEQWDGTSWNIVVSPNTGSDALNAVAAVSASNVWAVGNSSNNSGIAQTLTEHWDGSSWSVLPSPNIGPGGNALNDVIKVPHTKELWAVGNSTNSTGTPQTLIEFHC